MCLVELLLVVELVLGVRYCFLHLTPSVLRVVFPLVTQVAARRGFVDDIIDPALTRRILCQDLELLRDKPARMLPKKHSNIPL